MIILGAGISGKIAQHFFKEKTPSVYDKKHKEEVFSGHKALMRTSDPRIGFILGSDMEKITVDKAVFWKGEILSKSYLSACNMYSRKVSGGLHRRSIYSMEPVERYLLPSNLFCENVFFDKKVLKITRDRKVIFGDDTEISYDLCISTIPITELAEACGIKLGKDCFFKQPIYVSRVFLDCPCSINQTVYIPELHLNCYRMTIQKGIVIIESVGDFSTEKEIEYLFEAVGIKEFFNPKSIKNFKQEYGKLSCSDDLARRSLILTLTEEFNIYSFGRFAIWSDVMMKDLIQDVERIKKLISLSERSRYENKLSKLY